MPHSSGAGDALAGGAGEDGRPSQGRAPCHPGDPAAGGGRADIRLPDALWHDVCPVQGVSGRHGGAVAHAGAGREAGGLVRLDGHPRRRSRNNGVCNHRTQLPHSSSSWIMSAGEVLGRNRSRSISVVSPSSTGYVL